MLTIISDYFERKDLNAANRSVRCNRNAHTSQTLTLQLNPNNSNLQEKLKNDQVIGEGLSRVK